MLFYLVTFANEQKDLSNFIYLKIKYYDDMLKMNPVYCEYKIFTEYNNPIKKSLKYYNPNHSFAFIYSQNLQFYYGGSFTYTDSKIIETTSTIYVDAEKIVEFYYTNQSREPSICIYSAEENFRIPRITPLILMHFPISDKIKKYKKFTVEKVDKLYELALYWQENDQRPSRKIIIDPEIGFRPIEIISYYEDGTIATKTLFKKWKEIKKNVFFPINIQGQRFSEKEKIDFLENYIFYNLRFDEKFDYSIFFYDFPPGTRVWDYRYNIGYKIETSGKLKTPEELFKIK